jgi:hypothetical protein
MMLLSYGIGGGSKSKRIVSVAGIAGNKITKKVKVAALEKPVGKSSSLKTADKDARKTRKVVVVAPENEAGKSVTSNHKSLVGKDNPPPKAYK